MSDMAAAAFTLRQVHAIARADLRERRRRFSYLATLAGTLCFLYLVHAGNVRLTIHGQRGVYNSAWIGTLMALSVGSLLSLIGFYLVKNTLDGDRRTGVGEILAATPMSRAAYTLGKALSNFSLLASILALCAVAAGITQLLAREEARLDLVALLLPMAALAAPPVALAAAMAVLFEAIAWLRGSLGNVIFFFLWIGWLSFSAIGPGVDPLGFQLVESSFARQLPAPAGAAAAAAARGGISLNIGPGGPAAPAGAGEGAGPETGSAAAAAAKGAGNQAGRPAGQAPRPPWPSGIHWRGIDWTAAVVAPRLGWLGIAFAIALVAALPFSRFDPAREGGKKPRPSRRAAAPPPLEPAPAGEPLATPATPATPAAPETSDAALATGHGRPGSGLEHRWTGWRWWQELAAGAPRSRALVLVIAELRLLLRGRGFWWYAAAAGLWIGGLAAPAGQARATLLALAWIWPLPLWSEMGAREARYGTRPLVLSAPLPPGLQTAAAWAAGIGLTALAGSGVGLRLALAGDARGCGAWLAGCLFIPALALALGTLAGSPRLFEVVYLLLWYAGPMSGVAELDYTGATAAARAAGVAWTYPTLAAVLFTVAWAARARPER
ncbi:MAG TPA: hypothetical protein VHB47_18350 [Thermoanaerobaculia bacterium]|nr:hypothetical protein [Thermoanaerobaculia bacterium]